MVHFRGDKSYKKVRVSRPLLTLEVDGDRAVIGDTVVIRCVSQRGSAPIDYQFYHQGRHLGTVTVNQTEAGKYTKIIQSVEHSGVYYCEANNGIKNGMQRSEVVTLSVVGVNSALHIVSATLIPLVILAIAAFLGFLYFKHKKKAANERFFTAPVRNHPNPEQAAGSSPMPSSSPEQEQHYCNVPAKTVSPKSPRTETDLVYSVVDADPSLAPSTNDYRTEAGLVYAVVDTTAKRKVPAKTVSPKAHRTETDLVYSVVDADPTLAPSTNDYRTEAGLVYAVVDTIAKRKEPTTSMQENVEYFVTYSAVKTESGDTAAGGREFDGGEDQEPLDNIYMNFQNK